MIQMECRSWPRTLYSFEFGTGNWESLNLLRSLSHAVPASPAMHAIARIEENSIQRVKELRVKELVARSAHDRR